MLKTLNVARKIPNTFSRMRHGRLNVQLSILCILYFLKCPRYNFIKLKDKTKASSATIRQGRHYQFIVVYICIRSCVILAYRNASSEFIKASNTMVQVRLLLKATAAIRAFYMNMLALESSYAMWKVRFVCRALSCTTPFLF